MPRLRELQEGFAAAILSGAASRLSPHIAPTRLGAERRVQVYRNNFTISLTECLAATYPVLQRLVGEAFFAKAAHRFIGEQPPRTAVLFEYGEDFPPYLSALAGSNFAYLVDVGRFEWAINHAYHADEASTMRADALLLVPAESRGNLCLTLHPSVRLVASNFPVLDIWQANQPGAEADDTIDLDRGGVRLIVWRHAIDVVWRTLPPADHAFIAALAAGQPLGQAFIAACSAAAIANEFQPGPMFADLIASDLLTGFSLAPPEPER